MGYLTILVIFIDATRDLIPTLDSFQDTFIYETRCQVFVIVKESPNSEELIEMFRQCWDKKFLNVVTVFNEALDIRVFTYNPFWDKEQFLENLTDVRFDKDIFYNKANNLNGYPLRFLILKDDDPTKIRKEVDNVTGVITYKGKDIEVMWTIIRKLNASIQILNSGDFLKPGERNPWRQTNDLSLKMIDIKKRIITEQHVDLLNTEEMMLNADMIGITESLYPHSKDDLFIVIHKSGKIPYYLYLFMVLKFELWCAAFCVFIGVVFLWSGIVHFVKFCLWRVESLSVLRIVLNISLPTLPIVNSERVIMISLMLYSLILSMAFQSKLTSILMEPKYYPDINTLEQLDESGLIIRVYRTMIHDIDKALNGSTKHGIVNKMVPMPSSFDHAENSKNDFIAIFNQPLALNYYRSVYYSRLVTFHKHGRPILHMVKESPLPRYLAFQVSDGSPYLHVLNLLIRRFQEYGFFIIWEKLAEHNDVIKHIIVPDDYSFRDGNNRNNKLTIYHLQTAFMILFVGILLSSLVFVIEIVKKHIRNN